MIHDEQGLRAIYRMPSAGAVDKQIDHLDAHCRAFIAHSPFVIMATTDGHGACDVSPKGGPPGFVSVLDDHRLAIADLSGNNRLDSLRNLVASDAIALLFLIPGLDETLRVNGRGAVVTDRDTLERCSFDTTRPKVAIRVAVHEAFLHCAKALRRGAVWQPEAWPDVSTMPSPVCMMRDHARADVSEETLHTLLEEGYAQTMWIACGD